MSDIMAVLLNGVAQLEYDRNRPLTDYQQAYLDAMDEKMDAGIIIDGAMIEHPDDNQRIQFVVANMLHAMKSGQEGMTSALCSYIAMHLPELKQIKITEQDYNVSFDLVFNEDYGKQTFVSFSKH